MMILQMIVSAFALFSFTQIIFKKSTKWLKRVIPVLLVLIFLMGFNFYVETGAETMEAFLGGAFFAFFPTLFALIINKDDFWGLNEDH